MCKVVVIAPHPDDAELGIGGTIAKHVERGDTVDVIVLCTTNFRNLADEDITQQQNEKSLKDAELARQVLEYNNVHFCGLSDETLDNQISKILDVIEPIINKITPDILYVTHFGDNNQDHRAAYEAAQIVARPGSKDNIRELICYETPSGTDQTPASRVDIFVPNLYNELTSDHLHKKIQAFEKYESEDRDYPHPRSAHGISTYAKYRGMQAGVEFAEALCVMRKIVKI